MAVKKKTVRTGIVGSGFSATFHFEAVGKIYGTNVEVVGVHSIDVEGGTAYARKRDIQFFDNLDAMLDEVDVIHVCVPPVAHEPISVAGLKRDKFCLACFDGKYPIEIPEHIKVSKFALEPSGDVDAAGESKTICPGRRSSKQTAIR